MAEGKIAYCGIATKAKAMRGKLLTAESYEQLLDLESTSQVIEQLMEYDTYKKMLDKKENIRHRQQIETIFQNALYQDYERLYQFATPVQKQGMELLLHKYEARALKKCLLHLKDHKKNREDAESFLSRHLSYSFQNLEETEQLADFYQIVKDTMYGERIRREISQEFWNFVWVTTGIDLSYYEYVWKSIKSLKGYHEQEVLEHLYGVEIDWQNIMWIYRMKHFYQQNPADIYATLIPVTYKLTKQQLRELTEVPSYEAFVHKLKETTYLKVAATTLDFTDEKILDKMLAITYRSAVLKYPQSIAPIYQYLHEKEKEIERLTTAIEGIHYHMDRRILKEMIMDD